MFYRWVSRLESLQMPVTSFPAAAPDPLAETHEARRLDGALIAAAIASLWVLTQVRASGTFVNIEWALVTYAPIVLVGLLGALLVRPRAAARSIAAHVAAYGGLAALMGVAWVSLARGSVAAVPVTDVVVWGAFFAFIGLVIAVPCVVAWATALHQLGKPRSALNNNATHFRLVCVGLILIATLIGAARALTVPGAAL